jgi:hypothetical protein
MNKNSALVDTTYSVKDVWLDGSERSELVLREGEDQDPYYEIELTVGEPVSLISYATYDFVTTDI